MNACWAGAAAAAMVSAAALAADMQYDWLSVCGKCVSATISSKSGIGTANAVAEGKITRREIEGHCANWSQGPNQADCVRSELSAHDLKKVYRATADCPSGRITAIDGKTYSLAGKGESDIGKGRTRWRDGSGRIMARDNVENGLAIAQQWEVLCPGFPKASRTASAPPPAPGKGQMLPGAQYAVGELIEARYGREWVRGRVTTVTQTAGPGGPETAYDMRLDNGKQGIVPAGMLRKASGT
jgi:hypothetical protein